MNLRQFLLLGLAARASAFDYSFDGGDGSVVLTEILTSISPVLTPFTGDEHLVLVEGFSWSAKDEVDGSDNLLFYQTFLNGKQHDEGSFDLTEFGKVLPTSFDVGSVTIGDGGEQSVTVTFTIDGESSTASGIFQAYGSGVAIIPLLLVLVLAVSTNMVELSLYAGIFVGSCMVAGNINDGFKGSLDVYILEALADSGHGYVYLFSFFLSGLVGMMEKSGGMKGFTRLIAQYAKTPRTGQFAAFFVGLMVFFDDYANVLLSGKTLRPLMDSLCVCREKLAFMVDATAAPVASVAPVSSWVGFEVGLIQEQIDRIIELEGTDDIGVKTSGFGVFLQSLKYRYYPWFMLVIMFALIFFQHEFGPMLVAERKTEVYRRNDGGDGGTSGGGMVEHNAPREDQPLLTWNMMVPIVVMVFLVFYLLVQTGDDGSGDQSFMDKIEASDSYAALLWSTMGGALLTIWFYLAQIVKDGELIMPDPASFLEALTAPAEEIVDEDPDAEPTARFLLSVRDSVEAFLVGMGRIFPAAIVLTLAWASGSIMVAVGCDRLFANWIIGGIDPEILPTLSFLISLFMALATGTSWGTMSILFPLILVPTYQASDGDELIFYSTVAGVLSGSVAGDHMSPISDTTVLSSLSTECGLMEHVTTQSPYVVVIVLICVLVGTLPVGYDVWPNIISFLIGILVIFGFVYLVCKPVMSPTGAYDIFTTMYLKASGDEGLEQLSKDTVRAYNGEDLTGMDPYQEHEEGEEAKKLDSDPSDEEVVEKGDDEKQEPVEEPAEPAEMEAEQEA